MKTTYKLTRYFCLIAFLAIGLMTGCTPDSDIKPLASVPTSDMVKITATPDASNPNIIHLKNETPGTIVANWDLGNGETSTSTTTVDGNYAVQGSYKVKLTVFTAGGYASNTLDINIAQTNFSMLDREDYNFLTGGFNNTAGKTWRIESETAGHFGVGPIAGSTPDWWSAGPNEKAAEGFYDDRFIFKLVGFGYNYQNNGNTFANFQFIGDIGGTTTGNNDKTVPFTPNPNMTWSIVKEGNDSYLTFSNGGFIGYYVGTTRYKILKLNENELWLQGNSKKDGDSWFFHLVREDFTRPVTPPPPRQVTAKDIVDNFDSPATNVTWDKEALTLNENYDNPAPYAANPSAKVALYIKQPGNGFWMANMSTKYDYNFDLTNRHTIKMKVFIPSYNDFTTDAGKEGWASSTRLLKQVEVKLQDATKAAPWEGQVVLTKANLETDKWIELTFDFSTHPNAAEVLARRDLNKIVIQCGGEGHYAGGVFFLDDIRLE